MKTFPIFALLLLLISCTGNKSVYWCGDHPCINNKEKEAYFKKTMTVEKKIIDKKNNTDLTTSEEIIKKAKADQKKYELDSKLEKKRLKKLLKEEKIKAKLEKKRLRSQKKELAKKAKIDEKNAKKVLSKKSRVKIIKNQETESFASNLKNLEFDQLKDSIIKKNLNKSYPDINDIPN